MQERSKSPFHFLAFEEDGNYITPKKNGVPNQSQRLTAVFLRIMHVSISFDVQYHQKVVSSKSGESTLKLNFGSLQFFLSSDQFCDNIVASKNLVRLIERINNAK